MTAKKSIKILFQKKLVFKLLCFMVTLAFFIPQTASAHAYSASFTDIQFSDDQTKVVFSIDTLSLIELLPEVDINENGILEKKELKKEKAHIEELLTESVAIDKANEEQEATIEKLQIVKKEDKEFVSLTVTFPAFLPGDTFSLTDGFYVNDNDTNYINLITSSNRGEKSEAVLQGDNRTWTLLLTEIQQEQQEGATGTTTEEVAPVKETKYVSSWTSFLKLGMLHILTGYDHLLFLLALLVWKQSFKQYAAIVTSFTIAHSITISLAVLGIVDLPSRFVEAVIAFSICYVAAENLFRKEIRHRWGLTFLFGLIHGLGFANILKEMNIPKSHLASALFSFNIGIELVQLAIVILILPVLSYIHRQDYSNKFKKYISILIILFGAFWLFERLFLT
ncbi:MULTISPECIES: HupE/UreJ family protein [unclassified Bacillus (in: firmicutes)]|uniref:HupE/UreJ family protein n=1 Tax=unclassified Bacillus (in: firmicutes) TaxID=185979 RepID=UPI0008ED834C|nr:MULTISPECIES: HupE/UreJ family protein [unclassified Bacillus (in: firmicutes)]SFB20975.1 Hydrogenase/urease accessory protein HupE [Bacillus sp. UNCCL13]SFQ90939.1 Hydrogenase/urease accessory protein HupE [Bacillus sp. cl95]